MIEASLLPENYHLILLFPFYFVQVPTRSGTGSATTTLPQKQRLPWKAFVRAKFTGVI
jgi:hypothetical protein